MKPGTRDSAEHTGHDAHMNYETTPYDPRAHIARELQNYRDSLRAPRFRLLNVIASMHRGDELGEHERAVCKEAELAAGTRSLGSLVMPWRVLAARTMDGTSGPRGGYLADVELQPLHDALRGDSVVIAAGAQVFDGLLGGSVGVPRVASKSSAQWVIPGVPAPDGGFTLGLASATPRTVISKTSLPVQLLNVPSTEEAVRTTLRRDVGEGFDAAAVNGPGGSAPLGITNTPGVPTASGTSLSHSTILQQIEYLLTAGARKSDLFAVCGPTAGRILSARERATGSGFILDGGRLAGVFCTESAHVPASMLVIGVARQLAIASWGPGFELSANQSMGFNTASVDVRAMAVADVAVLHAGAFVVFGTVT
jgi:hypothetical protein